METKINLYEVPVTEVFEIVREETTKAIDGCLKAFQDTEHVHMAIAVKVISARSQYHLPIDAMLKFINEYSSIDEFEEGVMTYVTNEFHKSRS